MTTEEKARAYDKALEQAKKELNTCGSMDCDAARQIFRFFPQLAESEDERTRREIVNFILYKVGHLLDEKTEHRFIAYLEKQKEQKSILKFKVGDKIHLIDGTSPNYEDDCITIREIDTINYIGEFKEGYVPIKEQDKWELVKERLIIELSTCQQRQDFQFLK